MFLRTGVTYYSGRGSLQRLHEHPGKLILRKKETRRGRKREKGKRKGEKEQERKKEKERSREKEEEKEIIKKQ